MCESGGNYAINTGNGYYGAYQFAVGTWNSLGFAGYPNQAAPATQDAAVAKLWRLEGWAPWPGCAASLGL
jgi:resuscitation-promoting factor RpfA